MLRVIFNIFKSLFSLFFRPLKRLWCRRLKASEMDPGLPTVVTHSTNMDFPPQQTSSFQDGDQADLEMESWDAWDTNQSAPLQDSQSNSAYYQHASRSREAAARSQAGSHYPRGRVPEPEPEPEPDYFQDMIPRVKRPAKIVLKKKDNGSINTSAISSRLSVMDVAAPVASELQSWEEVENEWGEEVEEDLSWEAEEALKEKRRLERQTRALEQQRKKQQRSMMKKDGSHASHHTPHLAVRIS